MKKAMTLLAGTLSRFNKRTPFLLALHNSARTETSHTRTQLRDVTSCSHQREKGHQAKERTPFFSPKDQKAKKRGMEKAKESQAKAKVFGRAKQANESNLKA